MSYVDLLQNDPKIAERFWSKVDQSGGEDACWIWKGAIDTPGYGAFKLKNKKVNSHRVAYAIETGVWLNQYQLRHKCNRPLCCNPKHLVPGTRSDNMQDSINSNRFGTGERSGTAKLSEEQARAIKVLTTEYACSAYWLAKAIGINDRTIRYIRDGITWKHV